MGGYRAAPCSSFQCGRPVLAAYSIGDCRALFLSRWPDKGCKGWMCLVAARGAATLRRQRSVSFITHKGCMCLVATRGYGLACPCQHLLALRSTPNERIIITETRRD